MPPIAAARSAAAPRLFCFFQERQQIGASASILSSLEWHLVARGHPVRAGQPALKRAILPRSLRRRVVARSDHLHLQLATLRKERRRAYLRQRDRESANGGQLQVDAGRLELRLAARLADLERRLTGPAAARTRELLEETTGMAGKADGLGNFPAPSKDSPEIAEALVDGYVDGAERSDDAARVVTLQAFAEKAISRLAWLRSIAAD
jgi:hypothetical protein